MCAYIFVGLPDFLTAVYNASTLAALNKLKNHIFTMGSHFILIEWPQEVSRLLLNLLDLKNDDNLHMPDTPSRGRSNLVSTPIDSEKSPKGKSRSPSKTPREKRYWNADEEAALREGILKVHYIIHIYILHYNAISSIT